MVTDNHYRWDFIGLSTDDKPTPATSEKVSDGSTFYCSDTSKLYVWYSNQWYERTAAGGGGGSVNVVQTTGSSTTDVMSQNAVTNALADAGGTIFYIGAELNLVGVTSITLYKDASLTTAATSTDIEAITSDKGEVSIIYDDGQGNINRYILNNVKLDNSHDSHDLYWFVELFNTRYELHFDNTHSYIVYIDGGAIVNLPVAQTTGYNTTTLMSQDAITTALDGRIMQNAGAPTTSTVGTVGQLLEDTTNGKLYQCTAIDTSDPQNPSYTWSEVGAGGSSVNVVQTTGTSTTDVMSQDAATKLIYSDYGTAITNHIVVGDGTTTSPSYYPSITIGHGTTKGQAPIAIGQGARAEKNYNIAIGYNAVGYNGTDEIAIGNSCGSQASTSNNNISIGHNARAGGAYSVAIGSGATTTQQGEFSIGCGSSSTNGYNNSQYRLITGVYDGQNANDAVTVGQVNSVIDTINSALSTNIPHIGAQS